MSFFFDWEQIAVLGRVVPKGLVECAIEDRDKFSRVVFMYSGPYRIWANKYIFLREYIYITFKNIKM